MLDEICCYYCKYLKKNSNPLREFQCIIDDEILNCYNLKMESCNLYLKNEEQDK